MEKELNSPAGMSEDIFTTTGSGVILMDADGQVRGLTPQASAILRLDTGEHGVPDIGAKPHAVPGISGLTDLAMDCLRTKTGVENHSLVCNGVAILATLSFFGREDHPEGVICSFQDAYQINRVADKIESYKQISRRMESFINTSFDGIWIIDHNGVVLNLNKASQDLHKLEAETVVGMSIYDIAAQGLVEKTISDRVLKTRKKISEFTFVHGRQVLATGSPVMDEHGKIRFVIVNERDMTELRALREEIENSRMKVDKYQEQLKKLNVQEHEQYGIIAESPSMLNVLQTCQKLAQLEVSNILIRGESGTGKGLVAKYVHRNSPRSDNPFIQVNCAAIPETLMEAELFGYEKGAFTGARSRGKAGLIELAQGGTLFLDEIGDMPLQLQAKLLKYLDDNQFRRVGGVKVHRGDCIILAATNRDLERLSAKKKFRRDLFYRLSSFPINLPSLNERPEDIPPLAAHFIRQYNQKYNLNRRAAPAALLGLQTHHYRGNARELRNMIKKAVILNEADTIKNILAFNEPGLEPSLLVPPAGAVPGSATLKQRLQAVEKNIFMEMLKDRPTTRQMARALGIDHSTVVRKLKVHGLSTR